MDTDMHDCALCHHTNPYAFQVAKVATLRNIVRDSNMTETSYSHDVVFSSIFSFPFWYVYLPTPKLKNVHPLFIPPKINYASPT
ncbi:hypothetical protein E2C01_086212 [Portunus trituberculatus]|uniref:Uncharacterized protein n=1 Tax=Portunus trituberculatus TaxID=210409 RepID=A0A5B7J9N7_PORTR|nr:hypothetical protein [Portunus trituberculatus]